MAQTDQLHQAGPAIVAPSSTGVQPRSRIRTSLRLLWRYRVFVAGMLAIALAIAGEIMMRTPASSGAQNGWVAVGTLFMAIAALLVGLVAWVNEGFRIRRSRASDASPDSPVPAASVPQLVRRKAGTLSMASTPANQRSPLASIATLGERYSTVRTRFGWFGTAIGLLVTAALGVWLGLILRANWQDPLAGWVWGAMLLALLLTFVGLKPWPKGASLISHDPTEPTREPPMSRGEWLFVGGLLLVAALLRLWNLEQIPIGPYIDESGRALNSRALNQGGLVNREPFVFFGTGWWGVPNFYFWLVSQSMKLFGDSLSGARMVHALAGIGTVWFVYRTGRVAWSPRVGMLAGALMAVSDLAVHTSRTAGESTITLFFWTACFYFLLQGLKTRRLSDFVLGGIAGGFTLLGYASGKFLPIFLGLIGVYLLLRWGFTGMRRYLPGLALMAAALVAVFAPNALYQVTQRPTAFTERFNTVSIFTPEQHARLTAEAGTDNWGVILGRQYALSYAAFDVGQERGPFYPTEQPVLPVVWAALWILGTAYVVWRFLDARYALMFLWLLGGLTGPAVTTDTPTLQRALPMLPLVALVPAFFLVRVAGAVPPVPLSWLARFRKGSAPTTRTQARASSWLTGVVLAILVVALGAQVLSFYFGPYTARALYQDFTVAGRYIDKLDPRHDLVYQVDTPVMFGDPSPLIFLANKVELRDLGNIADVVPITDNHGRNVHFLVSPAESMVVDTLQRLYPGGTLQTLTRADGSNLVAAYKVPAETLDSNRYVAARYGTSGGAFYERQETRFGTLGGAGDDGEVGVPPNLSYPTTAEWSGGLVAPVYGTYRLRVDAPAGATLHVDGRPIVTQEPGGQPVEVRVVLARGTHDVRLSGALDSPQSHVVLLWGVDNGEQVPIGREYMWLAPRGALLAEVYPSYVSPSWITDPEMPAQRPVPSSVRRDGVFSWRNASYAFSGEVNPFARWTGSLIAPVDGDYSIDATTTAQLVLRIDGEVAGNVNVGGMDNRWPVTIHLTQGEHAFELRFGALNFNTELQVYWQAPGQPRQIMLPQAFTPAQGGVWLADEVAAVPSPDPSTISAVVYEPVTLTREIPVDAWVGAMGITVLPNGGFAVGDSGAHRLIIYDGSGKQVASWGGDAEGSDTFNDLSDVDSSKDGEIAALDAENALVRFFDGSGKQTRLFKPESLGITHARGAAWSADGHLYVADTGASRVIRIDKNGTIDQVLAEGNGTIPKLDQPVDVALALDGSVYTVDVGKRIVRFDASGVANGEWRVSMGGLRGGSKLAYWRDRVVITNPDANTVSLLDPRTGGVRLLSLGKDTPLDVSVPTGLAVGTDGNLYVVDSGHNRVLVLALQGQ